MQCPHCFRETNTAGACPFCGYDGTGQAEQYPLALHPGSILNGRYVLGHVLGQGGFGITYLALDDQTKERVAIKEYLPTDFAGRTAGNPSVQVYSGARAENFAYGKEQFLEEAKTLAAFIGNRNIVRIYSYFEENGTAYLCMEYVDGLPLDKYMAANGGRLSPAEADRLLLPLMEALEQVHAKGIVHRDIAPDNILVDQDGTAKLIDFGAARYSTGEKSKSLDVILKHGFAPKEQYMRRGRQGPWTDVYALAATYYYAVTGKVPPEAIERIDEDDLIPPSSLGVKLGDAREEALYRALAVNASERFQSMAEFHQAMLEASPEAQDAERQREWERKEREARAVLAEVEREKRERAANVTEARPAPPPPKKKSKLPLILAAVAVLALVVFGATKLAGGKAASPAETAVIETPTPTQDPQALLYAEAEAELEAGKPTRAFKAFRELGDYRDASERAEKLAHDMRKANCRPIAAGAYHTVGVKRDGTVVAAGPQSYQTDNHGQCDVSDWSDIVSVAAGRFHSIGLKADGSVIATRYIDTRDNDSYYRYRGQCEVSDWTDIVAIAAGASHTVGLKSDGTVVAAGSNSSGQCDVSAFRDIVAVSAGGFGDSGCTVGVKADGTAVAVGEHYVVSAYISEVKTSELIAGWQDVTAISSSLNHIVGLLADGTVVAAGEHTSGQCKVSDWTDIGVPDF